jgi:hypothetical protein
MIVLLSSLASANRVLSLEPAMDHTRNERDTIENTDHFCRFLLQTGSEGGRKDHFRPEFNTTTLAECQIADDIAPTGMLRATP